MTPAGAEAAPLSGRDAQRARPGELLRMDVDLVLVPVTITDPMNRLVTGLEQDDFYVYENNAQQKIKSFSCEDAPVSIGIIMDLSGSMTPKTRPICCRYIGLRTMGEMASASMSSVVRTILRYMRDALFLWMAASSS